MRKRSGNGASWASSDDTAQCNVMGATGMPRLTRSVTKAALNGRAALGISALPGSWANTVW